MMMRQLRRLSAWTGLALFGLCLGMASPAVQAHPPHARLNPDERQRLRQELRQHSGDGRVYPAPGTPVNNQPAVVAPPAYPAYPAYPPPGSMAPAQGRLSPEDRRALRQQLREQYQHGEGGDRRGYGAQAMPAPPGLMPAPPPGAAGPAVPPAYPSAAPRPGSVMPPYSPNGP